jgi:hypothetical protein
MTVISVCPKCQTLLAVPQEAADSSHLQCPLCEERFTRVTGGARPLPQALVAAPPAHSDAPAIEVEDYEDYFNGSVDVTEAHSLADSTPANGKLPGSSRFDSLSIESRASADSGSSKHSPQAVVVLPDGSPVERLDETSRPTSSDFDEASHFYDGDDTRTAATRRTDRRPPAMVEDPLIEIDAEALSKDLFVGEPGGDAGPEFVLHPSPKRRRRPTEIRRVFGMLSGGVVGILLGGYALLWLRGAEGDLLRLTQWLPISMLPSDIQRDLAQADNEQVEVENGASPSPDRGGDREAPSVSPNESSEAASYAALAPSIDLSTLHPNRQAQRRTQIAVDADDSGAESPQGSAPDEAVVKQETPAERSASEEAPPESVATAPTTEPPPQETKADDAGSSTASDASEVAAADVPVVEPSTSSVAAAPTPTDLPPGGSDEGRTPSDEIASARVDPNVSVASAAEPSTTPPEEAVPSSNAPTASAPAAPQDAPVGVSSEAIVSAMPDARLFSVEELAGAVGPAADAQSRFLTGELTTQEAIRAMGRAYIDICALAERLTLLDPAASPAGPFAERQQAQSLLHSTVVDPDYGDDVQLMAGKWLKFGERKNQGILLAGRVREVRPAGRWVECVIDMQFARGKTVENYETVVLVDQTDLAPGDQAGFAGAIVADPVNHISGYEGASTQVVVAGYAFDPDLAADSAASVEP